MPDLTSLLNSISSAAGATDATDSTANGGSDPAAGLNSITGQSAGQLANRGRIQAVGTDATTGQTGIYNDVLNQSQQQFAAQQAFANAQSQLVMANEVINGLFKQIREAGKSGKDSMSA
jgi:hypothetical protein